MTDYLRIILIDWNDGLYYGNKYRKGKAEIVDCIYNGKKSMQKVGSMDAKYRKIKVGWE